MNGGKKPSIEQLSERLVLFPTFISKRFEFILKSFVQYLLRTHIQNLKTEKNKTSINFHSSDALIILNFF